MKAVFHTRHGLRVHVLVLAFALAGLLAVPPQVDADDNSDNMIVHTVVKGEYLYVTGLQYGVPWQDIAARNNIESPYLIYPGDKLDINLLSAGKKCSDGWYITAYFTPLESDYAGTGTVSVRTDEGTRTFYKGFVEEIKIQGSGRTNDGDYLGYWGEGFHIYDKPYTSSGLAVKKGLVATHTLVIPYHTEITIPTLKEPWKEMEFTAADTGPAIIGKHIDIYAGLGLDAREEAFQ
jgi:3D (Asp-Asp-Asp) domain-containing protein/LysM repeat protein